MESVRATSRVRGGAIAVTVDSSGGLAGLRLSAAALKLAPDELAGEILACAKGAQAKLADQIGRTVSGVLGSDSETASYVAQAYADKFRSAADGDRHSEQKRGRRSE
jgi:hypothetical protein